MYRGLSQYGVSLSEKGANTTLTYNPTFWATKRLSTLKCLNLIKSQKKSAYYSPFRMNYVGTVELKGVTASTKSLL